MYDLWINPLSLYKVVIVGHCALSASAAQYKIVKQHFLKHN